MKIFLASLVFLALSFAHAKPMAHIVEACSHDIMKLVKTNQLPAEAATKLHMANAKETAEGYRVIAVLDHNGDHSKAPGHVIMTYDRDHKMQTFKYNEGYVTPNETAFTKRSTARLFDLGAEFIIESKDEAVRAFAEKANFFELEYDAEKQVGVFFMGSTEGQEAKMEVSLDGAFLSFEFLPKH